MSAQSDPAKRAETVNIANGDHTMSKAQSCRNIYVGGEGDLTVIMAGDGQSQTYYNLHAGTFVPVEATKVVKAGTTATLMVALF